VHRQRPQLFSVEAVFFVLVGLDRVFGAARSGWHVGTAADLEEEGHRVSRWILAKLHMLIGPEPRAPSVVISSTLLLNSFNDVFNYF
jgi:hypothetical protein